MERTLLIKAEDKYNTERQKDKDILILYKDI